MLGQDLVLVMKTIEAPGVNLSLALVRQWGEPSLLAQQSNHYVQGLGHILQGYGFSIPSKQDSLSVTRAGIR